MAKIDELSVRILEGIRGGWRGVPRLSRTLREGAATSVIRYAAPSKPQPSEESHEPIVNAPPSPSQSPLCSPLTWRVWPARQRPTAAVLTALAVVALSGLVSIAGGHVYWGAGFALILLLTQSRFFLPSTFRFGEDTLEVEHAGSTRTIPRAEVEGGVIGRERAILRVRTRGRRSTQILLYPASRKAEIAEIIGPWLDGVNRRHAAVAVATNAASMRDRSAAAQEAVT